MRTSSTKHTDEPFRTWNWSEHSLGYNVDESRWAYRCEQSRGRRGVSCDVEYKTQWADSHTKLLLLLLSVLLWAGSIFLDELPTPFFTWHIWMEQCSIFRPLVCQGSHSKWIARISLVYLRPSPRPLNLSYSFGFFYLPCSFLFAYPSLSGSNLW